MHEPIIAALVVAFASLTGAFIFGAHPAVARLQRIMVPVAVGVFLSVVFFELLPEAFHESEHASYALAFGFIGFYILAHLISQYHHHHSVECAPNHSRKEGILILLGDAVHNFVDGIVIAIAFALDPVAGVATTMGLLLHEVPQEIAEFSILLHAGYTRTRAALYNLLSASSVVVGTALTLLFIDRFQEYIGVLIAVAAGNLLYIAASDLLPELAGDDNDKKIFWRQAGFVIAGMVVMGVFFSLGGEAH